MHAPRIVLDTASFITGVRSPHGAARELLRRVAHREIVLVMDYKLALEYRAVALRPEHLNASRVTLAEMLTAIETLESFAEDAGPIASLRPISPDPNDDMIIELAVSASVDAVVSSNSRHLRALTETFGIAVLTPVQLLASLHEET